MNTLISEWIEAPRTVSVDTFAIGDIHGRLDLMEDLFDEIVYQVGFDGVKHAKVVCLGDYIDRGPNGLACLERVFAGFDVPGIDIIGLPGNHEQFLIRFLLGDHFDRCDVADVWLGNGGDAVCRELGFPEDAIDGLCSRPQPLVDALIERLGKPFIERMKQMPNHFRQDDYLFIHAGLHPRFGLGVLDQDWTRKPANYEYDPLWVRGPFLTHEGPHEEDVVVVHGHTIHPEPEIRDNRINLDTGAYKSNCLTAVHFRGDKMRFLQTHIVKQHAIGDLPLTE